MDRFRFLHAADIHLDSPLRGLDRYPGAPAGEIRIATRQALENLVSLAIEQCVAFVLIAGDLYDGDWKDYHTGLFFVAQMAQLREANIRVVVIKGNHDAANRMTRELSLPKNVSMLSHERPETVHFDDLGVAIHGQSFAKRAEFEDLSARYPGAVAGLLNVGMLHTCATGRDGYDPYAPCTLDGLRSKNYDYWALGHIHEHEELSTDPYIIFPGNIQGRNIGEPGAKGCVLVDVEDGRVVKTTKQALDVLRWRRCCVDAAGAKNSDEVLELVQQRMESLLSEAEGRLLAMRVEIAGACEAHCDIAARPEQWATEVRKIGIDLGKEIWIEKVELATTLPVMLADSLIDDGPLGELARFIEELKADPEQIPQLLGNDLTSLRKKLPASLLGKAVDANHKLPGGTAASQLLEQVQQMLMERLSATASSEDLA